MSLGAPIEHRRIRSASCLGICSSFFVVLANLDTIEFKVSLRRLRASRGDRGAPSSSADDGSTRRNWFTGSGRSIFASLDITSHFELLIDKLKRAQPSLTLYKLEAIYLPLHHFHAVYETNQCIVFCH